MKGEHRTRALVRTKLALAEKYERRAAETNSKPKKMHFKHKAERYRRQVENTMHE